MDAHVVDNPEIKRFELAIGDIVAVAYYEIENDRIILLHTEVLEEFSGRGIGTKLAEGVFRAAPCQRPSRDRQICIHGAVRKPSP